MQVGFIGAGNMARALAWGWGDPVLCTDSGSGRAQALADELGGEALASNRELAERADLVILAHKPAQLAEVAAEIAGTAKAVVSVLASTTQADLRAAYPGTPVLRRGGDTLGLRRAVASPGGTTARGLAALERGGLRIAFSDAMDDVVGA